MTVTKYYQAANGKVAKVVQAGNDLTPEEEGRLRKALGNYSLLDEDPVKTENIKGEKKLFTPTGKFVGADYKTGIKDSSFRSRLITLDNNEEKTDFFNETVGRDGWVIDKQGTYLLTPNGTNKLAELENNEKLKSNNLIAVDSKQPFYKPWLWEKEDWAEFAADLGVPLAAFTAGAGAATKIATRFSPLARNPVGLAALGIGSIGGGIAVGISELMEEGEEKYSKRSRQSTSETLSQAGEEALTWGASNVAGGLILKGLGTLATAGLKGFSPSKQAQKEVQQGKDFIMKATDDGLIVNLWGPEGFNRAFLGGGANIARQVLGRNKVILERNINQTYNNIIEKTFGIKPGSKAAKDLQENFDVNVFQNFADDIYNAKYTNFYNTIDSELSKDVNKSFNYILNDVRKTFSQNKNFDDVVKNYDAGKGLFYKYLEDSGEAISVDFMKLADTAIKNFKTDKQIEVFSPSVLKQSFSKVKKDLPKARKDELKAGIQVANDNIINAFAKGTSDIADDTFITILKPKEFNLKNLAAKEKTSRTNFLNNLSKDKDFMKDRVVIRLGKDTEGNLNFKAIPTPQIKATLEKFGIKGDDLGMAKDNVYAKLVASDSNAIPAFTPKEMNKLLIGINEYQIQSLNGKVGVKTAAEKLREAAFTDLDDAIINQAKNAKELKKILAVSPETKRNKELLELTQELDKNFGHMMKTRSMYKDFKTVTDSGETMKMMTRIAKGEQSPIGILEKITDNPEFTLDIANAFKALPKAKDLFKEGKIPANLLDKKGNYLPNALSKRQQDVLKKVEGTEYAGPMKMRLAYEEGLNNIWPTMMAGAANEKQALEMLSEQWFKHLGLAPEGFNLNLFKKNLSNAFVQKPVSSKALYGTKYTEKELKELGKTKTTLSPAEALLKRNPRALNLLKDVNKNLSKLSDEYLNENAIILNSFDDVIKSSGSKDFTSALQKLNQNAKTGAAILQSQAKKIIDEAPTKGFTPDFAKKYFTAISPKEISILRNKYPKEFKDLTTAGFVNMIKSTGDDASDLILNSAKLSEYIKNIGKDKFNSLYATRLNKNPYDEAVDALDIATKANQIDATGGLVAASTKNSFIKELPGLLSLGLIGGAAAGPGGGLLFPLLGYTFMVALATNKAFARTLAKTLKPYTKETSFKKILKDQVLSPRVEVGGVPVPSGRLGVLLSIEGIQNTIENARDSYERAKSIYGDDLGFGVDTGIPSIKAAQERIQSTKQAVRDDRLFPAFRAARSRAERMGLPNVAPIQTNFNNDVSRRKALAGNNPDTQAIAEKGQR